MKKLKILLQELMLLGYIFLVNVQVYGFHNASFMIEVVTGNFDFLNVYSGSINEFEFAKGEFVYLMFYNQINEPFKLLVNKESGNVIVYF